MLLLIDTQRHLSAYKLSMILLHAERFTSFTSLLYHRQMSVTVQQIELLEKTQLKLFMYLFLLQNRSNNLAICVSMKDANLI